MKLIVGLGNPGSKFSRNRHNTGFYAIEQLASKYSIEVKQNECRSVTGKGEIAGIKVVLAKPKTYVNLSGEAVSALMEKYKVKSQDIIVIYDDLDMPLGRIRVRSDGSSGGHNGLKSIIAETGSAAFNRIKIGISRPDEGRSARASEDEIVNYVLSNFTPAESEVFNKAIPIAVEAVETILAEGMTAAMNKYNKTAKAKPEKKEP